MIVWKTKDGRELALEQIADWHLKNIIRFLKRGQEEALLNGYAALSFLRGEHAQEAAESEIEREAVEYRDLIAFFESEAHDRGLK